jgi:hypothetical protein
MNREGFQNALFRIGRERDEAMFQRDRLIVQMRLDYRARNIQEESIDDEIRREVDGTGEIGKLTSQIKDFDRKNDDLTCSYLNELMAADGRLLTAAGLTKALCTLLRAYGRPMRGDDVEVGVAMIGFDTDTLENPRAAIANRLAELRGAGGVRFAPETNSYGLI